MADVLSQNEIEALLASMTTADDAQAETPRPEGRGPISTPTAVQVRQAEGAVILPLHKRRRAAAVA